MVDDQPQQTDQEWAEICYVPNWAGHSRKRADYRFLADPRNHLRQLPLEHDAAQLPFPDLQEFASKGTYKLFGTLVTNRKDAGDQVILVAARAALPWQEGARKFIR